MAELWMMLQGALALNASVQLELEENDDYVFVV